MSEYKTDIDTSLEGIAAFLKGNDELIKEIGNATNDATEQLKSLFKRLSQNKKEVDTLIKAIEAKTQFATSGNAETKRRQKKLLEQIEQVSKDIQTFWDESSIVGSLYAQRAALHLALGNTYDDAASQIVAFTNDEIASLRVLVRRAVLDTQARKNQAALLDAAVQLAKLGFRVALKLVA
jgi:hypothetical protein